MKTLTTPLALACLSATILFAGCATPPPPPPPPTRTTTTTIVPQTVAEPQYTEVDATKLLNRAFRDDYKRMYVTFTVWFHSVSDFRIFDKYKTDWIEFLALSKFPSGATCILEIQKEISDPVFKLRLGEPIRVYGKAVVPPAFSGDTRSLIVEVQKVESIGKPPEWTGTLK